MTADRTNPTPTTAEAREMLQPFDDIALIAIALSRTQVEYLRTQAGLEPLADAYTATCGDVRAWCDAIDAGG